MPPELLSLFLEEILQSRDSHTTESKGLLLIIKHSDPQELKWYVDLDNMTLWRKRAWLTHYERLMQVKLKSDEDNQKIFKRKDCLDNLRKGVASYLGIHMDDHNCFILALSILRKKDINSANVFGVDISDCPELDKPHTILAKGGQSYVI